MRTTSDAQDLYERVCGILLNAYLRWLHRPDDDFDCCFWINWGRPKQHGRRARIFGLMATPTVIGADGFNGYRVHGLALALWIQDRGLR